VWTVINEIFPARIRGRAVALCTATNWGAAFLVSQFFLSLVGALGSAPTFWLLALLCVAGWIWIFAVVPETRGRTLEEIEADWNA
jgi:MFS family permease